VSSLKQLSQGSEENWWFRDVEMYKMTVALTIAKGSENATIRAKQGRTGMSWIIVDSCGNDDKSEEIFKSIH
jgi:hypothetical protein